MDERELAWQEVVKDLNNIFSSKFCGLPDLLDITLPEYNLVIQWHKPSIMKSLAHLSGKKVTTHFFRKRLDYIISEHFSTLLNDLPTLKNEIILSQTQRRYKALWVARSDLDLLSDLVYLDCHLDQKWFKPDRIYPDEQGYWQRAICVCLPESTGHRYKKKCVTPFASALSALFNGFYLVCTEVFHYFDTLGYYFYWFLADAINRENPHTEKETLLFAISAAIDKLNEFERCLDSQVYKYFLGRR